MKLGVHSYVFTDVWSDDTLDVIDQARALGAEVFEIAVGDEVEFTSEQTRQRCDELGLDLVISPGGIWPLQCDISSEDPADCQRGVDWHRRNIDLAAEVGAVAYSGALYGHTGVVERRVPPPDEMPRVADGLRSIAEYGRQRGVVIVIEPMSHFRTHLVNTPEQVMTLVQLVDHPNLLVTEIRDYRQAIRTVGKRLWGMHACENDRGVPGGGLIPWQAIGSELKEIAFDGYVMLEAYNSSIGDFAFRRGMFQDVCPDATTFVRDGFAFLRGQFG